jgi:predicted phosphohydrolase
VRIVATSDCHGMLEDAELPPGDVLVLAGDVLGDGLPDEQRPLLRALDAFLGTLPYRHKVLVAGNHDWIFEDGDQEDMRLENAIYLEDDGVVLDGVRFYGSPWQPLFCNWAFNLPRSGCELAGIWDKIPKGTDVLVTHGPPLGILDQPHGREPGVGCELLRERVRVVRPRVHIFGHIHGSYGRHVEDGTTFMNVCLCDESYRPVQAPLVVDV